MVFTMTVVRDRERVKLTRYIEDGKSEEDHNACKEIAGYVVICSRPEILVL